MRRKNPSASLPRRQRRNKQRTLWHPICCDCIEFTLPTGYGALREYLLHREPQRLDLLVILQESTPGEIDQLPALMSRLGKVTLIEYKSVTDALAAEDASVVSGYGAQLMVQRGVVPAEITLGVIAVQMTDPFLQRLHAHGGTLEQVTPGAWEGHLNGSPLFMLETAKVWKENARDRLFYLLTPDFMQHPEHLFPLTLEQEVLYNMISERLIERKPEGVMALRNYEELKARYDRALQERLNRMSPEERFRGATVEERLKGLRPEERLQGLRHEEIARILTPEERLKGLKAEEWLQGLKAEDIASSLTPEQREQFKALLG